MLPHASQYPASYRRTHQSRAQSVNFEVYFQDAIFNRVLFSHVRRTSRQTKLFHGFPEADKQFIRR
jgi:hypothetical protein